VIDLLDRRRERRLSQAKLAEKTGLRPNTVSELESGSSWPDWSTLALLAWALESDLRFVPRRAVRVEDVHPRPDH
jgi:transcriptional regulator with XRE-family HTH domain